MKDKKYKYLEDLIEEYLHLKDEQLELPLQIESGREKYQTFLREHENQVLKIDDAQYPFKIYNQLKKYEENRKGLEEELAEVESLLKEFLGTLGGSKVSYEKKDESKSKITFTFWIEEDEIKSNRL